MTNDDKFIPVIYHEGEHIEAGYTETRVPSYKLNPLIEALPPMIEDDDGDEELYKQLAYYPDFDKSYKDLPKGIRLHLIYDILDLFKPESRHIDLYRTIDLLIRRGYSKRIIVTGNLHVLHDKESRTRKRKNKKKNATGFTFTGISGIGKTTALEEILFLYPQVIYHKSYQGVEFNFIQLVWLKIDCPFDGRLVGLCAGFFAAVDEILGTEYTKIYVKSRPNVDSMILGMRDVARKHAIGCLIVDEIQALADAKGTSKKAILNYLVNLVNVIGIPVIAIGTYKALPILKQEFRLARRATGQGSMEWHRMEKDESWEAFLNAIWRYQYTKHPVALTPGLSKAMYDISQGVTDFAIKGFMFAQWRAITSGKEKLTVGIIRSVAKTYFEYAQPVLDALKTNDLVKLREIDDIHPLDMSEYLTAIAEEVSKNTSATKLKETPQSTDSNKNSTSKNSPIKSKKSTTTGTEDIREIFENAKKQGEDPIQKLKDSNIIVGPDSF